MSESDKPEKKSGQDSCSCPVCNTLGKNPLLLSVVLIVIVLVAAIGFLTMSQQQVVKVGDNVSISYTLLLDDGSMYESNFNTSPVSFVVGSDQVLPELSGAVEGMSVGQIKSVKIPAGEAYGEYNSSLIHTVDKSNFAQTNFTVGETYYVVNHQTGAMSMIKILNVTNETVTWDENNPLAGKELTFVVKLDSIQNP